MTDGQITKAALVEYFLRAATPRASWQVGMELERMGRMRDGGRPLPYDGAEPSVRAVLETILERRGGDPILEGDHLIGMVAPWGTISIEPGGQVEWSSRPAATLDELETALAGHQRTMVDVGRDLGVRWLDEAVDPELPLDSMEWMPKARYGIMRPYMGARGRLAHRMMTQTASIQAAFDFADAEDWTRKFRAAALMTPVAIALFANSSRVDGGDSGWASYRQAIWTETDPDRCGLPDVVFEPGFDVARWVAWAVEVPAMFRHRSRGLAPAGGVPFSALMKREGCDALRPEDLETHLSGIFTDVRSYKYIEVRSADLQPAEHVMDVPTFWTGLLYHDGALVEVAALAAAWDRPDAWRETVDAAARRGLDAELGGRPARDVAADVLRICRQALPAAACVGDAGRAVDRVDALAGRRNLDLRA